MKTLHDHVEELADEQKWGEDTISDDVMVKAVILRHKATNLYIQHEDNGEIPAAHGPQRGQPPRAPQAGQPANQVPPAANPTAGLLHALQSPEVADAMRGILRPLLDEVKEEIRGEVREAKEVIRGEVREVKEEIKNEVREVKQLSAKNNNRVSHLGPLEEEPTPSLKYPREIHADIPPLLSTDIIERLSDEKLQRVFQAYWPGKPVPRRRLQKIQMIFKAVGSRRLPRTRPGAEGRL